MPVHQLWQRAAQSVGRLSGARLLAAIEHTLVAVALGEARQAIDVEVDLFGRERGCCFFAVS